MAAYEYVTVKGVIIPNTVDNRASVIQEYKSAFGQDLVITPNTPQGVLINAEVLSRDGIARNNATLANQINPNLAGGIFLDAILALTGSQRVAETFSHTLANLTGVPLTVIPAGVTASNVDGFIFQSETSVILDSTGNASVQFSSVLPGSIACPANTLTTIVNGVLGWETVTNPVGAILGSETQSDEQARVYRKNTLALQGDALPLAITSALNADPGVRSLRFLENITSFTTVIQGITMVPHSIWVCVDGGTDQSIADILVAKKSGGCDYNGSVNVIVIDPTSGQAYPVKFDRPTEIPVLSRVTVKTDSTIADPTAAVKSAIIAYANGLVNGEPGFVVGADVSPFELGGAVTCLYPGIYVKNVEVSYASPVNYVVAELPIAINEIATIIDGSITVILV